MATTDLHMHLLGYDYFADRPSARMGLSRTAGLIARACQTARNCLLFDNGDALQGGPMGDYLAEKGNIIPQQRHPAIAAMNALRYDAATVGNHDFSFGLGFLRRTLEGVEFPIVSTNLRPRRPLPVQNHILLERQFHDEHGQPQPIRIGVLGFLPPQTTEWEPDLKSEIEVQDILLAALYGIAALRRQGAHLIVVLSHSGIGPLAATPMSENASTALAALPGIDVVIAGHTHRVFPSPDHPQVPGIDAARGTLAGNGRDARLLGFSSGVGRSAAGTGGRGLAHHRFYLPCPTGGRRGRPSPYHRPRAYGTSPDASAFPPPHRPDRKAAEQLFRPDRR
ncbi:metallophosphoesterase [Paracoccus sp. (in: a-proteobacteria)]|uniref:metallophosphoesterase n=1 Tax=Paracoccus sp. TaxID=267 RepID=UPI002AFF9DBD|nr:metallophosphoesterase [Paracoccus sp. (in: a-proteobacteria)]